MRNGPSTFRSADDQTIGPSVEPARAALEERVASEWRSTGERDLVGAIHRNPQLLAERSLLLNLAIDEFRACRASDGSFDLDNHCGRFRQFGSSVERSIFRQLETQRYIDDHPDLLDLFGEPKWPEIGEAFVDFDVLEELGRGGAARVYLCREPEVGNRKVVVKATPFCDFEASILGRLNHPNIVPIFSTGVAHDLSLQYLCMPYRGRSTLADLIDVAFHFGLPQDASVVPAAAARWLPAGEAAPPSAPRWSTRRLKKSTYVGHILSIGVSLADALNHAHAQGILHGDLKPSNVLLASDGSVLLLDFNLSQDGQAMLAVCGGTLSYMPPERLQHVAVPRSALADPPLLDAKADVYSFGALLYELLAGRTPAELRRDADDPSTAAAALVDQLRCGFEPLRRHNRMVSGRLETLIGRCLAFDPDERPATIAEVRDSLARELQLAPSIGRQVRRRRVLFASLLATSLGAATAAGAYMANRPPRHMVYYKEGMERVRAGQPAAAVEHFTAALAEDPELDKPRFRRAVAYLALDKIDLAMRDFDELAQTQADPASMAYLGYCSNLKQTPRVAIAWYEKALKNGVESAAVYNNLGASYLAVPNGLSNHERYLRAEEYLLKAYALDASEIIRLNLIHLSAAKAAADPMHNPIAAWRHAEAVLNAAPEDPVIKSLLGEWYALVASREALDVPGERDLPSNEKTARKKFAELITDTRPEELPRDTPPTTAFRRKFPMPVNEFTSERFYMEPVVSEMTMETK
jgi:eukaryotic-like serine/threonine-protein kinase